MPPSPVIKRAFVLGAGLGLRLRPLTEDLPKPLVPIFQKPLITFALDHLIEAGCEEFVVNTHPHPERFAESFPKQTYRGRSLVFVHEPALLGTGGGIRNALPLLKDEPFIVYSGDVLTDLSLGPLVQEHTRRGNQVTLALRETSFPPSVALRAGRVVDIASQYGQPGDYDFANISVWETAIAAQIPAGVASSFVPALTRAIGKNAKVGGVVTNDGRWFNVGSCREYLEIHRIIAEEGWKPRYLDGDTRWPVPVAPDAAVDSTAVLSGFSSVGRGCEVGANAVVANTILWSGAQVASESHLQNCVVRSRRTAAGEVRDLVI